MRSRTSTLVDCLYILGDEIESGDGVANAAMRECADRMALLKNLLMQAMPLCPPPLNKQIEENID